jgi:hypothetical protein
MKGCAYRSLTIPPGLTPPLRSHEPGLISAPLFFQACGVLNHTGYSHPFDEDGAKGFVRCEGVGAIVLRRLSDAERDGNHILCEMPNAVAGSAGPEDGRLRVLERRVCYVCNREGKRLCRSRSARLSPSSGQAGFWPSCAGAGLWRALRGVGELWQFINSLWPSRDP